MERISNDRSFNSDFNEEISELTPDLVLPEVYSRFQILDSKSLIWLEILSI